MEPKDYKICCKLGFKFSNESSESIKHFEITLNQLITWKEDEKVGGINGSLSAMLTSGNNFLMGHVLKNVITFLGTNSIPENDADFRNSFDECFRVARTLEKSSNNWEKLHLKSLQFLADGEMSKACDIWEEILLMLPTDIMALKFAHDFYFYLGKNYSIRNSLARVLPFWKRDMPYFGYVMGMYSFGLCETEDYLAAYKYASLGLELNPTDGWSIHTLAHVYEMSGQFEKGANFLESTKNDWNDCGMLSCHLYWHMALYCLSNGNTQKALQLFDDHIEGKITTLGAMLDLVDACSILFRLQLLGVDVTKRWQKIYNVTSNYTKDHILTFNDLHFMMSYLGSQHLDTAHIFLKDLNLFTTTTTKENGRIMSKVGLALANSFLEHHSHHYSNAVDLLWPIREDIRLIGGSNAQRDLFNLLIVNSAVKSDKSWHVSIARAITQEKKELQVNALDALSNTHC